MESSTETALANLFHIGTSWKMNKLRGEAREWVTALAATDNPLPARLSRFVIPPFTAIDVVVAAAAGSDLKVGAQNVHHEAGGAYTGDVSAAMLRDAGCTLVEIGHSERRATGAETDALVAMKVRRVLDHGLQPLICIGDTAAERDAGAQIDSACRQAVIALSAANQAERARCLLAYEPVWAIGVGGTPATPAQVAPVHAALKQRFADTPVLYGGSVDTDNAVALSLVPGVDGLFIGRGALDLQDYLTIVKRVVDSGAAH